MAQFVAYLIACWGVLLALATGAGPAATGITVASALYSTLPIFIFLRQRRWSFYPSAAFRLLVVRPVLYIQLLLPFVSAAGVLGGIIGAPFGSVIRGGQI